MAMIHKQADWKKLLLPDQEPLLTHWREEYAKWSRDMTEWENKEYKASCAVERIIKQLRWKPPPQPRDRVKVISECHDAYEDLIHVDSERRKRAVALGDLFRETYEKLRGSSRSQLKAVKVLFWYIEKVPNLKRDTKVQNEMIQKKKDESSSKEKGRERERERDGEDMEAVRPKSVWKPPPLPQHAEKEMKKRKLVPAPTEEEASKDPVLGLYRLACSYRDAMEDLIEMEYESRVTDRDAESALDSFNQLVELNEKLLGLMIKYPKAMIKEWRPKFDAVPKGLSWEDEYLPDLDDAEEVQRDLERKRDDIALDTLVKATHSLSHAVPEIDIGSELADRLLQFLRRPNCYMHGVLDGRAETRGKYYCTISSDHQILKFAMIKLNRDGQITYTRSSSSSSEKIPLLGEVWHLQLRLVQQFQIQYALPGLCKYAIQLHYTDPGDAICVTHVVTLGTDDERDFHAWVLALYRLVPVEPEIERRSSTLPRFEAVQSLSYEEFVLLTTNDIPPPSYLSLRAHIHSQTPRMSVKAAIDYPMIDQIAKQYEIGVVETLRVLNYFASKKEIHVQH